MALVRWAPVRELSSLQNEMNRLFTTFFDTPTSGNGETPTRRWIPAMDLVEAEEHGRPAADDARQLGWPVDPDAVPDL